MKKYNKTANWILLVIIILISTTKHFAGIYEMNQTNGRYIRLEVPGDNKDLRFSEIQVFSGNKLISQGLSLPEANASAPERMSSVFNGHWEYDSRFATDANTLEKKGVRTNRESNPWFVLDLGQTYAIDKIIIYKSGRFRGVTMKVGSNFTCDNPSYIQEDIIEDDFISFESGASTKKNLGAIWMIGDQVNLGNKDLAITSTPRSELYAELNRIGYDFTFTGHLTDQAEGLPNDPSFTSHSCLDNVKIKDISDNLKNYWEQGRLKSVKPNIVCVMLGTNDIDNDLIDKTPERMKTLLDELYALPDIGTPLVLVGAIPPNQTIERKKTNVNIYNEGLESLVRSYQIAGKNIEFVDHFNALGGETTSIISLYMQSDVDSEFGPGIHLNATGNIIVGKKWLFEISKDIITKDIPEDPWAFPKTECVRSLLQVNTSYYQYFFDIDGVSFSVIPPKPGVVHYSGKKPWMWRNIFYSGNTGQSITNDIKLINEGFYAVNVYGDVTGHPDGNKKVKYVYDYLTKNYGFAPTFSASAMSRGGFMVMRFANEYPDLIEGILMDNACSDGLSWPAGVEYAGDIEYAPGQYYTGPGSKGSFELYLQSYTQYSTLEEIVEHLKWDSPINQLGPLAKSGVKILSICGSQDHAVPYEENDLRLEQEYKKLGGDINVIVEDKGHRHGQVTNEAHITFLNFVRDNVFRVPNPCIDTITITTCDSYTTPSGKVWTTSKLENDTILNAIGSDSIISIDLTIKEKSTSNLQITTCNSYTTPSGKVWTTSRTENDTIPNAVGCDSIITIDLTINNTSYTTDVQTCLLYTSDAADD